MAKATKRKPRTMTPPGSGAKPSGKAAKRSNRQDGEYRKVIDKMLEKEGQGAKFQLQLSHLRGGHAHRLCDDSKTFGENHTDNVAADLGIRRLSLTQCMRFYKLISKSTLSELCALTRPPSWRMMGKWSMITDDKKTKRTAILEDILKGNITADGFDGYLRGQLRLGAKKSRRPTKPGPAFRKIEAGVVTLADQLTNWVPRAVKEIAKIEDTVERRETKVVVRSAIKQLKAAQAVITKAIVAAEKAVA